MPTVPVSRAHAQDQITMQRVTYICAECGYQTSREFIPDYGTVFGPEIHWCACQGKLTLHNLSISSPPPQNFEPLERAMEGIDIPPDALEQDDEYEPEAI